jgi:hypothetical protein
MRRLEMVRGLGALQSWRYAPVLLLIAIAGRSVAGLPAPERRDVIITSDAKIADIEKLELDPGPDRRPDVVIVQPWNLPRSMVWFVNNLRFVGTGQLFLRENSLQLNLSGRESAAESKVRPHIAGFPDRAAARSGANGHPGGSGAFGGAPGQDGGPGQPGENGRDCGSLTIVLPNARATQVDLAIVLNGQGGGDGGNGGPGGRGGDGVKGETASSGPFGCNRGGGNGGNGGRGGSGGAAGCGGSGGRGGTLTLLLAAVARQRTTRQEAGLDTVQRQFLPSCLPGPGGLPGSNGRPGDPGPPGAGGAGGDGSGFCQGGHPGSPGPPGGQLASGTPCSPTGGVNGELVVLGRRP